MTPQQTPVGDKKCPGCNIVKPLTAYHVSKSGSRGVQGRCKLCAKIACREWQKANPERSKAHSRKKNLKINYGLTEACYAGMDAAQGGLCAICLKPSPNLRRLAVDHCHTTGKIRALLCDPCNIGLGYFRDSPELLEAASAYMKLHLKT